MQADLSSNLDLTWCASPATLKRKIGSSEIRYKGELLRWSNIENHLMIFKGTGEGGSIYPVVQVWQGSPPTSYIGHDQQQPEVAEKSHERELTWDEAIHLYKKWGRDALTSQPHKNVAPVATMVLQHRRARFIKALCLAKSNRGGDGAPTKQAADENLAKNLQRIMDLEEELKNVKEENAFLVHVGEFSKKGLSSADIEINRLQGTVTALQQENENLKNQVRRGRNTIEELIFAQQRDRRSKEDQEKPNGETARLDEKCGKLREEVDGGSVVVHTETESRLENEVRTLRVGLTNQGGSDPGQPDCQEHNLPSVRDTEKERGSIVQKLKDLYFDHFHEGNAKDSFGRCVSSMVTGLLDIAQNRYDEALSGMARALGEKKGPGEDAKVAFNYYCRRNWKQLFADHPCESSTQTDRKVDGADHAYDPFDCDGLGGIVPFEDVDLSQPSETGACLASLRKSVMVEFEHSLSSGSENAIGLFETCFNDLWHVTVIMFLQDPQFRFWGDYPVWGNFDRREHQPMDAALMAGQKIVTIVPPVMRLPKGMQPGSGDGAMKQCGIVHAKALVDSDE